MSVTYEFARCSCGWRVDIAEDGSAGEALNEHRPVCPTGKAMRGLLVPMWSIAWPRYDAPKVWGLEMDWLPIGSQSLHLNTIGLEAKRWYLFADGI